MARGDHFFVWRQHKGVPFQHHAIDVGDGTTVHFTDGGTGIASPGVSTELFEIRRTPLDVVARRDVMHVVNHRHRLPADRVVERAISQVGRRGYHLLFDNCEHFACWCVAGRDESRQVTMAFERLGAAGVKALAAGTVRVTSKVGIQRLARGASPWMLIADAAQWITEAGGHHIGIRDPQHRKRAARAVGVATALGVGVCGGPVSMAVAGSMWAAGELAAEASRATYEKLRQSRRERADGSSRAGIAGRSAQPR